MLGEAGAKGRDHLLQQDNRGNSLGLRQGNWKLVRDGAVKKGEKELPADRKRPR